MVRSYVLDRIMIAILDRVHDRWSFEWYFNLLDT